MGLLTSLLVGKPLNILAVAALFGVAHFRAAPLVEG